MVPHKPIPFDIFDCDNCLGYRTLQTCNVCGTTLCHFCSDSAVYIVFDEDGYYLARIGYENVDIYDYDIRPWEDIGFACSDECLEDFLESLNFSMPVNDE